MAGYDVKMVKVVVEKAIEPRKTWTSTVSVDNGKVIMRDLKANTTYRVDVDGYRNDFMVFGSQRFVKTLSKSELHLAYMRCIS